MFEKFPQIGQSLSEEHLNFLKTFSKSCRHSILKMVTNAQSGHPGGSLSSIDYLATIYAFIISQTGEKVVVSNGHISPAVYSTLAELKYIPKEDVVNGFRKFGQIYEGHITRHVPGIEYGTGPLGIGVSVASSFALSAKLKKEAKKSFCLMGDGEAQEGQLHEMINFTRQHKLNNLILFVDYNKVQLTDSLKEISDIDLPKTFASANFNVLEINGHDYQEIWSALGKAYSSDAPTVIIGNTIMGKGVDFMEKAGEAIKSDWHGKAPKSEEAEQALNALATTDEEKTLIENFCQTYIKWHPSHAEFPPLLSEMKINQSSPIVYKPEELTDNRTAYGKALLDLAKNNKQIVALTADLKGSVMTKFVSDELPEQYIECGICEQHMVSAAGGLSLENFIPFASTFGAFLSSRAKDQARVNDINYTNVKMVATHCGLSVGEDGPTHQAIDDAGSFLGFFNTMVIDPADPNQTDRVIRYIASHYGNFYVRMGRHKIPAITKEDGTVFYDENYKYEYGRCDKIREGKDLTIVAIGSTVSAALSTFEKLAQEGISAEIIAATSIKKFDNTLLDSIKKTQKVLTVEDHNPLSGLSSQLSKFLTDNNIYPEKYHSLAVTEYQLSGKAEDLYHAAKLDADGIFEEAKKF